MRNAHMRNVGVIFNFIVPESLMSLLSILFDYIVRSNERTTSKRGWRISP